jgi:hypothetical protein
MIKGDKVYVVENYLVEELTTALLAGEVGLAVVFNCHADPARVHITDYNGVFWEIPTTAVCTVPEGHLSDLYREPCPACGLQLSVPRQISPQPGGKDVIMSYRPPIDLGLPSGPKRGTEYTLENLKRFMHKRFPDVEDDCDDKHPMTAVGVVLLAAAILDTADSNALIRFTGYSREFISAINFNMENNRIWSGGRYLNLPWTLPNGSIDSDRFWDHIDVACGMLWVSKECAGKFIDPCAIYWREIRRHRREL